MFEFQYIDLIDNSVLELCESNGGINYVNGSHLIEYLLYAGDRLPRYQTEFGPGALSFFERLDEVIREYNADNETNSSSTLNPCHEDNILSVSGKNECRLSRVVDQVSIYSNQYSGSPLLMSVNSLAPNNMLENVPENFTVDKLFRHPESFILMCSSIDVENLQDENFATSIQSDDEESNSNEGGQNRWSLARDSLSLTETISEKTFAGYSFTDFVRDDNEVWDVSAAIGYEYPLLNAIESRFHFSVRRKGGDNVTDDESLNEFSVGWLGEYRLPKILLSDYPILLIDVRYITDDSLDARAVSGNIHYPLPLDNITGFGGFCTVERIIPLSCGNQSQGGFYFKWYATAVLDLTWIDNPGDTFPDGFSDYRRIGADVEFSLAYFSADWPFTPGVNFRYRVRDDLEASGNSDATFFEAALTATPRETEHFQFSLRYETGQDLIKLSEQQQWTFEIGVRY